MTNDKYLSLINLMTNFLNFFTKKYIFMEKKPLKIVFFNFSPPNCGRPRPQSVAQERTKILKVGKAGTVIILKM